MKYNEHQADADRQHDGAQQQSYLGEGVTFAPGLGRQPRGSHAHKAECPIQNTEQVGTDRYSTKVFRTIQVAQHGGVHQAEQRHGQIGQHQRPGQCPQAMVCTGHYGPFMSYGSQDSGFIRFGFKDFLAFS